MSWKKRIIVAVAVFSVWIAGVTCLYAGSGACTQGCGCKMFRLHPQSASAAMCICGHMDYVHE